ncbi:MAG: NUDIX hydrolase [Pseudomonadales bacterium]
MHRDKLIRLLQAYPERYPEEQDVATRFLDFVTAQARCFERDLWAGHVTGSAWLVNRAGTHVLLTHHRKLGRWLQLGGHSDGNPDTLAVAMQEAREESGLAVVPLSGVVFDLDIHEIPERKGDPAHFHYDVRFALYPSGSEDFTISAESLDLAWVPIADLRDYSDEWSVLRMAQKWHRQGAALLAATGGG